MAHAQAENTARHVAPGVVRSLIPARIDRLPWSPFHTRMVAALGVAWILDGTLGTYIFLKVMEPSFGWRIGFLLGPVLGLVILLLRRNLPESSR